MVNIMTRQDHNRVFHEAKLRDIQHFNSNQYKIEIEAGMEGYRQARFC